MLIYRQHKIDEFSSFLLEFNDPIETTHEFIDGCYIRTMHIPADTSIVGYKHLKAHLNVLSKGKCTLYSNFRTIHIKAYSVFSSPIGEQKSFYFLEDSVFSTIHKTSQTDLKTMEKEFVLKSTPEPSKKVYVSHGL